MLGIKPDIIDQVIWTDKHIDVFVQSAFQSLPVREKRKIAQLLSAEYIPNQFPDVTISFIDHATAKTLWTFDARTLPRIIVAND